MLNIYNKYKKSRRIVRFFVKEFEFCRVIRENCGECKRKGRETSRNREW